jgi:UDP-glucose 4-epimerase
MNHSVEGFDCFNIGTGIGLDVNAIGAALQENCTREVKKRSWPVTVQPLTHGPDRPGDLRCNIVSNAKAKRVLGWSPETSFEVGAQKTCQWFADHLLK